VVALVRDQLFDAFHVYLGFVVGPLLGFASDLLCHRHARLAQRGIQGGSVALIRALQRHRYHCSCIQIDGVLGLVCQVGAPILHLRNPGILIRGALPFLIVAQNERF
jgi:hypothetical protein